MTQKDGKHPFPDGWMKLDNAAKIYPAVTRGELTGVFRISVVLNSPVKITALKEAVKETAEIFPSFSVELCRGFFWYYLEYNGQPPRILLDDGLPCQAFPKSSKGEVMYRILARANHISVEFLHILTDGGGAMMYLKTLLNIYHRIALSDPSAPALFPDAPDKESARMTTDLFKKHFKKNFPHPDKLSAAWHLPYKLAKAPRFSTMSFVLPTDSLLATAKGYNSTITEFLTSVYLNTLQELRKREKRGPHYLRVQVPIDLRRRFDAITTRNFSVFVMPEIDMRMGDYTFAEILQEVKIAVGLMANDKRITKIISRNVSSEYNPVVRIIPLFLKSPVLRIAYHRLGISQFSGVLTNMGRTEISEAGAKELSMLFVIPPPPHYKVKVSCGVATLGNNTIITFGSVTGNKSLEQTFIRFLTGTGIPAKILSIK